MNNATASHTGNAARADVRRIVVGYDRSPEANRALRRTLSLERESNAEIHVVHAVNHRDFLRVGGASKQERRANALEMIPKSIIEQLERLELTALEGEPQRIFVHVRLGPPVESLIQAAADYGAECIVVGTHGRTGMKRVFLGSVAEELVRIAPCPVHVERLADYGATTKSDKLLAPIEIEATATDGRWSYHPVSSTQRVSMSSRNVSVLGPSFD